MSHLSVHTPMEFMEKDFESQVIWDHTALQPSVKWEVVYNSLNKKYIKKLCIYSPYEVK